MKTVCAWCERDIARPTVGIDEDDYVVTLICKSCRKEVLEEGDKADISELYAAIHAKSGRNEN